MTRFILAFIASLFAVLAQAADNPVRIGLDAEYGLRSSTSAQAIEQGIRIAIEEINQAGGVLGGRPLELVTRDNRSVTAIGKDNLRDLAAMPDMVAVFGGKFSPVYIECVPVAQELGILLLDPWGSANPIIDHDHRPSYTFRLSLKDAWAASAMLRHAQQTHKTSRIGVLLPNTSWGRSNQTALSQAASKQGITLVGQRWYNWGDASLLSPYLELRAAGAEAIVLVANEVEGSLFVRELASLPASQRLPIISHWGITGGDFARLSGDALQVIDLSVIQTFSFVGLDTPVGRRVLAALKQRYGISSTDQIKSPVGVAHAYDLTHLLARAINKAGTTKRARIRDALEQLPPYEGLVRHYHVPFSPDRHEALTEDNILFARYTADDRLIPIDQSSTR